MSNASDEAVPSLKVLETIEAAVKVTVLLIPQIAGTSFDYLFRSARFVRRTIANNDIYPTPPYTFLAVTTVVTLVSFRFWLASIGLLFSQLIDGDDPFIVAVESGIGLQGQLEALMQWSFTEVFISTATVVVCVAAIAHIVAKTVTGLLDQLGLDRALCYVAGCQQIQFAAMLPVLWLLWTPYYDPMQARTLWWLFLTGLVCAAWSVVVSIRLFRGFQPSGDGRWKRFGIALVAVAPVTTLVATVYSAEKLPAYLESLSTRLIPAQVRGPSQPVYEFPYVHGVVVATDRMELTFSVSVVAGGPLFVDAARLRVGPYFSGELDQVGTLIDSSDGQTAVVVVREDELKWLKIAVPIPDNGKFLNTFIKEGEWWGLIEVGPATLTLPAVKVQNYQLVKDVVDRWRAATTGPRVTTSP